MKLLILNGPNLNLLGVREPEIYGNQTYNDLCQLIEDHARELGVTVEIRQSNHEGVLVDWIQAAGGYYDRLPEPGGSFDGVRNPSERFDGLVLNPAAYTHSSVALADAVKRLTPREKRILALRFYDGRTQMEVAKAVGISQAQVSRLEKNAIRQIKKNITAS